MDKISSDCDFTSSNIINSLKFELENEKHLRKLDRKDFKIEKQELVKTIKNMRDVISKHEIRSVNYEKIIEKLQMEKTQMTNSVLYSQYSLDEYKNSLSRFIDQEYEDTELEDKLISLSKENHRLLMEIDTLKARNNSHFRQLRTLLLKYFTDVPNEDDYHKLIGFMDDKMSIVSKFNKEYNVLKKLYYRQRAKNNFLQKELSTYKDSRFNESVNHLSSETSEPKFVFEDSDDTKMNENNDVGKTKAVEYNDFYFKSSMNVKIINHFNDLYNLTKNFSDRYLHQEPRSMFRPAILSVIAINRLINYKNLSTIDNLQLCILSSNIVNYYDRFKDISNNIIKEFELLKNKTEVVEGENEELEMKIQYLSEMNEKQDTKLKQEIDELKDELGSTRLENILLRSEVKSLSKELDSNKIEIHKKHSLISQLSLENSKIKQDISSLNIELSMTDNALSKRMDEIKKLDSERSQTQPESLNMDGVSELKNNDSEKSQVISDVFNVENISEVKNNGHDISQQYSDE